MCVYMCVYVFTCVYDPMENHTVLAAIHHSWLLADFAPLPPQVHNKDVIVLEPHPHHTLLASFGEDTAETEEDIVNTHMWCEV